MVHRCMEVSGKASELKMAEGNSEIDQFQRLSSLVQHLKGGQTKEEKQETSRTKFLPRSRRDYRDLGEMTKISPRSHQDFSEILPRLPRSLRD